MKKFAVFCCSLLLAMGLIGNANAISYDFSDLIDDWTIFGLDSALIRQGYPLSYTHDITDEVDLAAGDIVTEAYLELDFTNDWSDDIGSTWNPFIGLIRWDFSENASYAVAEDGTLIGIGEVDNESFTGLYLNIDWLNDDGLLDVTVSVSNQLGTASAWLDHSRVYGTAETASAPVPEPTTMILLGSGLLGLAAVNRKRLNKKS
jgi:hypothetical protein